MKGWKTWVGAVVTGIGAFLKALGPEYTELAEAFVGFGMAVIAIGLGHKVEKNKTL